MTQGLLSSDVLRIRAVPGLHGENVRCAQRDARAYAISDKSFGILEAPVSTIPDVPPARLAVRLLVVDDAAIPENEIHVSEEFYLDLQSQVVTVQGQGIRWSIRPVTAYRTIERLTFEQLSYEDELDEFLDGVERQAFDGRHLLGMPGSDQAGYRFDLADATSSGQNEPRRFGVREIQPTPSSLDEPTMLAIDPQSQVQLFVPHKLGGIDIVFVVDASWSMQVRDMSGPDGSPLSRLSAALRGLAAFLGRRRYEAQSKLSRAALISFGRSARLVYPLMSGTSPPNDPASKMVELTPEHYSRMREALKPQTMCADLDRSYSDVVAALEYAENILTQHAGEGNERLIVLLSDGANWRAAAHTGERVQNEDDPDEESPEASAVAAPPRRPDAVAESLYVRRGIRTYTIALGDEEIFGRHFAPIYDQDRERAGAGGPKVYVPDVSLMEQIAQRGQGLYSHVRDPESLVLLMRSMGEGIVFPLRADVV